MKYVFLRWWLFFCLMVMTAFVAGKYGAYDYIYQNDPTYISFVILGLLAIFSLHCGWVTWLSDTEHAVIGRVRKKSTEIGWFVANLVTALGMLGTLVGLISSFSQIFSLSSGNVEEIKSMILSVGSGCIIAVLTTLIGLIASILLQIQYFNLDNSDASSKVQ